MCGIMGYIGPEEAVPIVLDGLARLEYRGYDSAGIAVLADDGSLAVAKDAGKLSNLQATLEGKQPPGRTGIGHTRWATHGKATSLNAHPHQDTAGDVVVIHNGIVENYLDLKKGLVERGETFVSETDTEVLPHLIAQALEGGCDLREAVQVAMARVEGAAAVVAMRRQEPGVLVAARVSNAGGVVIGYGDGAMYVASDLTAILPHTRKAAFLNDGETVRVTEAGATYYDRTGAVIEKPPVEVSVENEHDGKGIYRHYMAKEIAEQPEAVLNTIRGAVDFDSATVSLPDLNLDDARLASFRRVVLVGMGTSLHAAQIGRTYLEQLAGLPAESDNASEYRYRGAIIDESVLMIAVLQSGETVDTLAAMHAAKAAGATVVAVCNTPGSQATRVADGTVFMRCGPEVAVASTKTFLGSLTALYLLACRIGVARGILGSTPLAKALSDLARLPTLVGRALEVEPACERVAEKFAGSDHFLFLGRGVEFPVAMEGALKLKEVSYIHAEGYAAGEMKHGPIALIDEHMPIVALALRDDGYSKMMSNIEEVRARNGVVIAIATEGDEQVGTKANDVIQVPEAPPLLAPMVGVVPLQLLAYHIALARGADIDQPRNLAKTVTVE